MGLVQHWRPNAGCCQLDLGFGSGCGLGKFALWGAVVVTGHTAGRVDDKDSLFPSGLDGLVQGRRHFHNPAAADLHQWSSHMSQMIRRFSRDPRRLFDFGFSGLFGNGTEMEDEVIRMGSMARKVLASRRAGRVFMLLTQWIGNCLFKAESFFSGHDLSCQTHLPPFLGSATVCLPWQNPRQVGRVDL